MCGIVGKVVRQGVALDLYDEKATKVMDTISHRGPDMQGSY